jgi:ADP-ribosylglycohydrolase
MIPDPSHALGAALGALVGDAAGAVLEFLGRVPTPEEVDHALTFPGGGCWAVAPGQITDDGEMTIALLGALSPGAAFDADAVAAAYVAWYASAPFDVGHTTATALHAWTPGARGETAGAAEALRSAATGRSMDSKANGSLMRATPLGVWGSRLDDATLAAAARSDSSLTHPNPSCRDAVAAYGIAIAHLIRTRGAREAAFVAARDWAEAEACEEVRDWLDLAVTSGPVPFRPMDGFVKIAFVHAFRYLMTGHGYEDALRATLAGGGDTDTNACIVGGLLGAAEGVEAIPAAMRTAVLTGDTTRGRPRPAWLHPARTEALVQRLVAPVRTGSKAR